MLFVLSGASLCPGRGIHHQKPRSKLSTNIPSLRYLDGRMQKGKKIVKKEKGAVIVKIRINIM